MRRRKKIKPRVGSAMFAIVRKRNANPEVDAHLTTDTSIPCLSMNLIFSSRSQYCGPTGRPPLGSWSKIKSLSSDFPSRVDDLMKGTDDRDRKSEAYRGRYTWVWMSTKSFLDAMGEKRMDDQRPHGGEMS